VIGIPLTDNVGDVYANEDAFAVARLREAGAIGMFCFRLRACGALAASIALMSVIAKTNMNELSGFKSPFQNFPQRAHPALHSEYLFDSLPSSIDNASLLDHSGRGVTNGWSAVGGQTSSAYVFGGFEKGGDPLGSSSGSAVGLSAGWGVFALGTDTTGSTVSGRAWGTCSESQAACSSVSSAN